MGNGEESNQADDDRGHGVEPAANEGEDPEGQSRLDHVEQFSTRKAAELSDAGVDLVRAGVGQIVHLLGGDGNVDVWVIWRWGWQSPS